MSDANASMTAIVEFQIRAENTSMDEWLATWHPRAEDARVGEPETTAYEAAVSLDDDSCVLIFERYAKGSESLEFHSQREAHGVLTSTMGERNMTRRRVMSCRFDDVPDYGWWARSEVTDIREGAIIVVLGMRFSSGLDAFLDLSRGHADYCWENEPDTLIYSGGIAIQDSDRGPDIKAGDLVFVMACTDMAAVDKHAEDPQHVALGEKFPAAGIEVENTFMNHYRSTGQGYLSKPA